jgi:hypothetical protein
MTVYFARPNLVDLGDATGYSLASGGPSANAKPTYAGDTVIFDANSGPRRTIGGYFTAYAVQMLMSVSMDFTSQIHLTKDSTLMGSVQGVVLDIYNGNNTGTTYSLEASRCLIGDLGVRFGGDGYWQIVGNLTTTGQIYVAGSSYTQYLYFTDYANVTCGSISVTGAAGSSCIFTGYGINLIVTGAPSSSGGTVCGIANVNAVNPNSLTLTDKSAMVKGVLLSDTWNFTNDTSTGQGTGGVQFNGNTNFSTFNGGKGAVNIFTASATYTATNWIMDGSGQYNIIKSTSTTPATLAKSGGGTIAANFCNFNYINCSTSPATTIRATNSKLTGGGTGITLVGMTSRFMPFF